MPAKFGAEPWPVNWGDETRLEMGGEGAPKEECMSLGSPGRTFQRTGMVPTVLGEEDGAHSV